MAQNQNEMFIEDGTFSIDDYKTENTRLHGKYQIKMIRNKAPLPEDIHDHENIICQSVFKFGKVLVRIDTEEIEELIDVFIRYTHDPCKDLELDHIYEEKQMRWGTICPKKKTLFKYRSKVFIAYGRYIFGYDKWYAEFRRVSGFKKKDNEDNDDSDDEEKSCSEDEENSCSEDEEDYEGRKKQDEITQDRIILKNPDYEPNADDYVYSFCIYDEKTGVLDAFGLYR